MTSFKAIGVFLTTAAVAGGCTGAVATSAGGRIPVVAAELQYGDVVAQVGGPYVSVTSVEKDPDTDPHTYEVSAAVAQEVAGAALVVQNGLGYDSFMADVEAAAPSPHRRVIVVGRLPGLRASAGNPHLWYLPATMPEVADEVAADLSALEPSNAGYFRAQAQAFKASLRAWLSGLAAFAAAHPRTPVATTEPVGDYLLEAAGLEDLTPFRFQADVMNGVDPAPQDVTLERRLLSQRQVDVFVYNEQVTDSLTGGFKAVARKAGVPVVGVYETMPAGFHYQTWMLAELDALERAVTTGASSERL